MRLNVTFWIIFLVLFQSCSKKEQENSGFQIDAKITGVADGNVKLIKLDLITNEPISVDSTKVTNGHFNFKGKVNSAYLHTLSFSNSPEKIHLFLDNSKIIIKGDIKNSEKINVSGSREDSLFRSYSLDDIFDRKKGKEIMLQHPRYNYAAMVAYYQFQFSASLTTDLLNSLNVLHFYALGYAVIANLV